MIGLPESLRRSTSDSFFQIPPVCPLAPLETHDTADQPSRIYRLRNPLNSLGPGHAFADHRLVGSAQDTKKRSWLRPSGQRGDREHSSESNERT